MHTSWSRPQKKPHKRWWWSASARKVAPKLVLLPSLIGAWNDPKITSPWVAHRHPCDAHPRAFLIKLFSPFSPGTRAVYQDSFKICTCKVTTSVETRLGQKTIYSLWKFSVFCQKETNKLNKTPDFVFHQAREEIWKCFLSTFLCGCLPFQHKWWWQKSCRWFYSKSFLLKWTELLFTTQERRVNAPPKPNPRFCAVS